MTQPRDLIASPKPRGAVWPMLGNTSDFPGKAAPARGIGCDIGVSIGSLVRRALPYHPGSLRRLPLCDLAARSVDLVGLGVRLAFEIAEDRARIDAQVLGGLGAIAVVALQHLEDVAALKVLACL